MSTITDTLVTAPDRESDTISFQGDTPSGAYSRLTDAVYREGVDIESLDPHTEIGEATYDTDKEVVVEITIYEDYL